MSLGLASGGRGCAGWRGATRELAEQSWYIFGTSVVSWLAATENPLDMGEVEPRFDLFLDVLLRGLPARGPAAARP